MTSTRPIGLCPDGEERGSEVICRSDDMCEYQRFERDHTHLDPIICGREAAALAVAEAAEGSGGGEVSAILNLWHFIFPEKPKREDCPHFNIDGKGQCNLFIDPSECSGYCRTLSAWGLE